MPDKEREANFAKMVAEARARYDAMTPEQKAAHDNAQRESRVQGMTGDEGTTLIKPFSSAAAGKSREDDLVRANDLMMDLALALESKELEAERVRSQAIEECAKVADKIADDPPANAGRDADWTMGFQDGAMAVAAELRSLPPPSVEEGGEQRPPLKAEFTKSLPGGTIDDATFELIESALDRADAPCQDASGRWLKLHERISELTALRKAGEGAVAVAWSAVNPDGETVTTHDGCAAEYWADEGWPVTPLYAHPSPAVVGEGWRDISTAPKDGTQIILFWPFITQDGFACGGHWYDPGPDVPARWHSELVNGGATQPTYWQPFPLGPNASPSIDKEGA